MDWLALTHGQLKAYRIASWLQIIAVIVAVGIANNALLANTHRNARRGGASGKIDHRPSDPPSSCGWVPLLVARVVAILGARRHGRPLGQERGSLLPAWASLRSWRQGQPENGADTNGHAKEHEHGGDTGTC